MLDTIDLSDRVFIKGESDELVFDSELRFNDTLYEGKVRPWPYITHIDQFGNFVLGLT